MNLSAIAEFVMKHCKILDNIIVFPKLFTKTTDGRIRYWRIFAFGSHDSPENENGWLTSTKHDPITLNFDEMYNYDGYGIYFTLYGQEGGKQSISAPTIIDTGKNPGKKNETSPLTQAVCDAYSKFAKKIREGAVRRVTDFIDENNITFADLLRLKNRVKPHRLTPMAYHSVEKNWKKVVYPCELQEKMDGTHYVAVFVPGDVPYVDLYPRGKIKNTQNTHIADALFPILSQKDFYGFYVCGELCLRGMERQDVISAANQETTASDVKLDFYIFDCFTPDEKLTFDKRWEIAKKIVGKAKSRYIKIVDNVVANNREDIELFFKKISSANGEGIIIRNYNGLYEFGINSEHRTFQALKYKLRDDAEYKIVGFTQGQGKMLGQIIFECETVDGKRFHVDPKWPEKSRREWFVKCSEGFEIIGKMATIQYDKLSKDGIPIQPKLISIIA